MVRKNGADTLDQAFGSFQTLVNMRQVGKTLRQTGSFYAVQGRTLGTYYDGGVQNEPEYAAALLLFLPVQFWANPFAAYYNNTQLQVIHQSSVPAAETQYTSCLLVVNNYAALGITLGSTLDVEMTGAAAFRWRKNGGGWTAGVPTLTGTSIDGGNATLYFLATTGFAATETWAWTRTDAFVSPLTGSLYDWPYVVYTDKVYFIASSSRLMVYENGGVRSVGYRPVFGSHVALFENHLFVANYLATTPASEPTTCVSANSDLSNIDNFYSTDVNEADVFTIPQGILEGGNRRASKILGYYVKNQLLYVISTTSIWVVQYFGLPLVFKYTFLLNFNGSSLFRQPVLGDGRTYLVGNDRIFAFDGTALVKIDDALLDNFAASSASRYSYPALLASMTFGGYDSTANEVLFYYAASNSAIAPGLVTGRGFYVYQEKLGTWYYRAAHFSAGSAPGAIATLPALSGFPAALSVGYPKGYARSDDAFGNGAGTMLTDMQSSAYAYPIIETQDLTFDEVQVVHENNELYFDAFYNDASGVYSTSGIAVDYSVRNFAEEAITWNTAAATLAKTARDGALSMRFSGRIIRFRFRGIAASGSSLVNNMSFNRFVMSILNIRKDNIRL